MSQIENMYLYLKSLTGTQQVGVMFVILFGLMLVANLVHFGLSLRDDSNDNDTADRRRFELRKLQGILRTSWVMLIVFWVGWMAGDWVAIWLFGLLSFFALREFLTLSPTRRGDHRSLVLAFFAVLPMQYWLVGAEHFDLFTVFIPVYVFLALPVASALADDPTRFLERNAKLQWGIMVCIYGMSHVPALLLLDFPNYDKKKRLSCFLPGHRGANLRGRAALRVGLPQSAARGTQHQPKF